MNALQCYTRFQGIYQEKSSRYFDQVLWAVELLNDSVFDLRLELAVVNPSFVGTKITTVQYTFNKQEYPLPPDLVDIELVEVTDLGGPPFRTLDRAEYWQKDAVSVFGPTAAWLQGGGIGEPFAYYTFQPVGAIISPIAAPTGVSAVLAGAPVGSVGLPFGNIYYVVYAIDGSGNASLASVEVSVLVNAVLQQATVSWTAVPGAANYLVFRGPTPGGETVQFTAAASPFVDTGTAGTPGSPASLRAGTSQIGFIPIPGRTAVAPNVKVNYNAVPSLIQAIDINNIPDLPIDWHPLIPWRMALFAALADNAPGINGYSAGYNSILGRLLVIGERGRGETNEQVEIVDDI